MRSLFAVLALALLASHSRAATQDESHLHVQEQPEQEPVEGFKRFAPEAFLNASRVLDWHQAAYRDIFEPSVETQKAAVRHLEELIVPIIAPRKYVLVEPSEEGGVRRVVPSAQFPFGAVKHKGLINYIRDDAKLAIAEAAFTLGVLYATGVLRVVEQDDRKATALYQYAADYGSVFGHLALAHRYEQGFGVPASCTIAYSHLKVAAVYLAQEADADQSYPQKPRQVLLRERARTAAFMSDAEALLSMEQLNLEQELAGRGDPEAVQRIAFRQLMGLGVEPNVGEAVDAFERAAANGDAQAMLNLGLVHTQGIKGVQNYTKAHELFRAALKEDLPGAYNGLGHLYLNGMGVEANSTQARQYFAMGAARGDPDAVYNLALIYMYGLSDKPVNATQAHALLKEAYRMQQIKAPLLLAELHAEYEDVPGGKSCERAMEFLWVFVDQRSDWSAASMDALEVATGIQQPGGTSDLESDSYGAHDEMRAPLPHDPRRAVLMYTILAEQGSLAASINAAWLLERGKEEDYGGRRDRLVKYLYMRAALAESTPAQIDYANWLLRRATSKSNRRGYHHMPPPAQHTQVEAREAGAEPAESAGQQAGLPGGRAHQRAAPQMVGGASSSISSVRGGGPSVAEEDQWAAMLRLGLAGDKYEAGPAAVEQARLLYVHARSRGDPEAATNLAWMHAMGIGMPRNLTAAIEECETAIRIAEVDAERWAPRVALLVLQGCVSVQRLLPDGLVGALGEALVKAIELTGDAFDAVAQRWEAALTPVADMWTFWARRIRL